MTRLSIVSVLAVVATLMSACGSDAPVIPKLVTDPAALYTSLTLNHRAVILSTVAPYDTIRLDVVPLDAAGQSLQDVAGALGPVTYSSPSPSKVQVDSDGLVHALAPASQLQVVATLRIGNVSHRDYVYITVTNQATPPTMATFSIHPVSPDSAKTGISPYGSKTLSVRALDEHNDPIPGVFASFTSTNPAVATVDAHSGSVRGLVRDTTTLVATTTVYGVTKIDSLPFVIGFPITGTVNINLAPYNFSPTSDTIGVGGRVTWANHSTKQSVDVVFDDPSHVSGGNIAPMVAMYPWSPASAARTFTAAGVYTYHSPLTGKQGAIVVVRE
jgi:plastocyanin